MTQSLMVVATEAGTGKSVVSLGLLDLFERQGVRAGFFKPVGLCNGSDGIDPDVLFIHGALGIPRPPQESVAATSREVAAAIEAGRYDEMLDRILEAHSQIAREKDVVLCEGVDSMSAFPALDSDINIDIAKNIDAPLLLVTTGHGRSVEDVVSNVTLARGQLEERGARVLGTIVNRVDEKRRDEFTDALRWQLRERNLPLYGVLPMLPVLARPRVRDVVRTLGAKVLAGEANLETQIRNVLVAAMGLNNALHYFEDGSLIIAPGDREEILLAAAAAYASGDIPRPSGIVLSGGFEPRRKVMQLARSLSGGRLPILQASQRTFETAIAINEIKPALTENQEGKVLAIRSAMEEYVEFEQLLEKRVAPERKVLTPKRFLRELRDKARANRRRIVLPESNVDRILRAVRELRRWDAANIVLLGDETEVRQYAQQLDVQLDDGVSIVDPRSDSHFDEYVGTLVELRKHKGVHEEMARDLMRDRTYFGTMMVYQGRAHGMVSGATTTTQATLRPAFEFVRTKPGFKSVSSVFFMCLPDRVLVYGDCAVIPNPTVEQLAEIALASAETAQAFGIEPRVAMLSYSTGESGKGEDVELVREATKLVQERNPQLCVEGPIQYDAAVDPQVARTKLPDSRVAGRATVFIFPDLNTGNNTYKAVQRSSGAIAIGPVLQGLRKPVNDLSRGATVNDIVNTVIVTAIQAQSAGE
jgi:phosphate acetyltransferase